MNRVAGPTRFQGALVFQTKRIDVSEPDGNSLGKGKVSWSQMPELLKGVGQLMADSFNAETTPPPL